MKYEKILEVMERQARYDRIDEDWKSMLGDIARGAGKVLGGLMSGIANFFKAFGDAFKNKAAKSGEEFAKEAEERKKNGSSNEVVEHNEAIKSFVKAMNNKDVLNTAKNDAIKKDQESSKNMVEALKSYIKATPAASVPGPFGGKVASKPVPAAVIAEMESIKATPLAGAATMDSKKANPFIAQLQKLDAAATAMPPALKTAFLGFDPASRDKIIATVKSIPATTPPKTPTHGHTGGTAAVKQFNDFLNTTPPPDAAAIQARFVTLDAAAQKAVITRFEEKATTPKYSDVDVTLGHNEPQSGQKITLITYNVVCQDDEMDMPAAVLKAMFESFNATGSYTATGAKIVPDDIKLFDQPLKVRQGQVRVTGQTPSENAAGEGTALGTQDQIAALNDMYGRSVVKMNVGADAFSTSDLKLTTPKDRKDVAYIDFMKPYTSAKALKPPKTDDEFNGMVVKYLNSLNDEFKRMRPKGGLPVLSLWNTGGTFRPAYQIDPNKVYTVKVDWK